MVPERRAFPRIDCDLPATIEFSSGGRRVQALARVESISCEGAEVVFTGELPASTRPLTLHLATDEQTYRLAATVVSVQSSATGNRLGLQLVLAITDAANRQAYAEWITRRTIAASNMKPSRAVTTPRGRHEHV